MNNKAVDKHKANYKILRKNSLKNGRIQKYKKDKLIKVVSFICKRTISDLGIIIQMMIMKRKNKLNLNKIIKMIKYRKLYQASHKINFELNLLSLLICNFYK